MRYKVLRGFSLGGGRDVFPGDIAEIPPALQHLVPAWRTQGKLGEQLAEQPTIVHRGRGKYDLLDAEGEILLKGVSKAEAEKELAWLINEE